MSKELLEKAALGLSVLVIAGAIWFWAEQVGDVLELLSLAYGE